MFVPQIGGGAVSAANCMITGAGLRNATAGQLAGFTVQVRLCPIGVQRCLACSRPGTVHLTCVRAASSALHCLATAGSGRLRKSAKPVTVARVHRHYYLRFAGAGCERGATCLHQRRHGQLCDWLHACGGGHLLSERDRERSGGRQLPLLARRWARFGARDVNMLRILAFVSTCPAAPYALLCARRRHIGSRCNAAVGRAARRRRPNQRVPARGRRCVGQRARPRRRRICCYAVRARRRAVCAIGGGDTFRAVGAACCWIGHKA